MSKHHTSLLAKCHFYWSVSGWAVANTCPALAIMCVTSIAFWWGLRWCGSKWPEQLHSQLCTQTTCTAVPTHHSWNDGLWNFVMGFQVYWLRNLPQLFLVSKCTALFLGKTHGRQMDRSWVGDVVVKSNLYSCLTFVYALLNQLWIHHIFVFSEQCFGFLYDVLPLCSSFFRLSWCWLPFFGYPKYLAVEAQHFLSHDCCHLKQTNTTKAPVRVEDHHVYCFSTQFNWRKSISTT